MYIFILKGGFSELYKIGLFTPGCQIYVRDTVDSPILGSYEFTKQQRRKRP
jgi:hypothetical protein